MILLGFRVVYSRIVQDAHVDRLPVPTTAPPISVAHQVNAHRLIVIAALFLPLTSVPAASQETADVDAELVRQMHDRFEGQRTRPLPLTACSDRARPSPRSAIALARPRARLGRAHRRAWRAGRRPRCTRAIGGAERGRRQPAVTSAVTRRRRHGFCRGRIRAPDRALPARACGVVQHESRAPR